MKVYQIFKLFPQVYQPYNIRLVNSLKKHKKITTIVISQAKFNNSNTNDDIFVINSKLNFEKIIRKFYYGFRNTLKYGKLNNQITFLNTIQLFGKYSFLINNRHSIFHIHNINSISVDMLDVLLKFNIKYIVSLRGFDITIKPLLSDFDNKHISNILIHAWRLHAVCESLKNEAVNLSSKISKDKISVIYRTPNYHDAMQIDYIEQSPEIWNLFTISRIHWKKCISESLISLKLLKEKNYNVKYHIIGGYQGDEKAKLLYLIKKMDLKDNVVLHGYLTENQFKEIIGSMHICWFPTINEGIPNSLYLALECRVPIVASETDGIPELIEDKSNGLLFSPYNFQQLAEKTELLFTDKELRLSIQKNAARTPMQSEETEIESYIKLYTDKC